ncbi:ABC transporter permease [Roseovarius indicus]|uniref:ABC transporter permease n=1 Tax=Roseovarius indicus TaxID=540747 RepID=A0A0T5P4F5_9RHOB|nr:ABC transporter permease [Roseovarius indicus]KRS16028.1 ABC transporter permease [Roseovarius indicus]QEW28032.1 putative D,D-dipeptide transport system permease protein DdpC [Roseovarius indicus]SFE60197.1 peptide/nickel transport system permease protein [Roseovarius indicus]
MSWFVIGYYTLLLGGSCLAAYFNKRSAFLLLFSLTLVSFVLGIVGGTGALKAIAVCAGVLTLAAMVSYAFREFLIALASEEMAKELRTAPLTAAFGMFIIFTYAVMGIFAPLIAPHGEAEVIASAFAPADSNMLLGADQLGRDMFSRIVYGTRNSVGLALSATLAAFFFGALAGLLAATKGGWFDQFMGRLADVIMSIPSLIFALLMLSIFGPQIIVIIVAVAIIYAPRVFRLTRAVAGNVVVMDYIEAAKLRGEGTWYLIRREILPNSTAPLVAEFGLEFCFVFLLVAGLSFLGLGIQPPTADWGSMVRENATLISFGDITPLIPAAAIALLTVSVNFVVDWMLFRSSGLKER